MDMFYRRKRNVSLSRKIIASFFPLKGLQGLKVGPILYQNGSVNFEPRKDTGSTDPKWWKEEIQELDAKCLHIRRIVQRWIGRLDLKEQLSTFRQVSYDLQVAIQREREMMSKIKGKMVPELICSITLKFQWKHCYRKDRRQQLKCEFIDHFLYHRRRIVQRRK